ncbi:hypothetical protein ACFYO1_01255 [Nocardia sp. NPDC006044]|uniref:hypothetical protein n=1 Tax=Nocardia sp. NPDC006044 TaxID=3364306 RepID=UPI0036C1594D
MFHKTATVAVTGLLAVAATLAVAAGTAGAAPSSPSETAPSQQADAAGVDAQDADLFGIVTPKGDKKGKKEKSADAAPKEPTAADKEAAAALNSALRDFLRPPHGGAEMGPLGKTSDEWLDLFLGPRPGAESTPKAKPIQ